MTLCRAELISTGAELLSGRSVNTHARLLGERLGRLGVALTRDTTVPDDPDMIQQAVADAARRVPLVFVSGGLGPTNDDVTRDVMARLLNRSIITDAEALAHIRVRVERAGRPMNAARARQALVLDGAQVLPNAVGAAPGERLEQAGVFYVMLPGPPPEFQHILDAHVVPWLTTLQGHSRALRERVLLVHGLGEGDILQRFEQAHFPGPDITTAYCAGAGRVEVRVHPRTDSTTEPELDEAADTVARLLGTHVYARERVELEELIGRMLVKHRATLALAESCTGGMISQRITGVPGSSQYYRGGVVCYHNDIKVQVLGVPRAELDAQGAVSAWVAERMAQGVRERLGADHGLAVTGIAGPSGGTDDKPVGLVYWAHASPTGTRVAHRIFTGNRETIREQATRAALFMLLREKGNAVEQESSLLS